MVKDKKIAFTERIKHERDKAGKAAFMGATRIFMYFTIQSNIAIVLICAFVSFLSCCIPYMQGSEYAKESMNAK